MTLEELKDAMKEKNLVIGSRKTISKLKMGRLKKVFISENCRQDIKDDVEHYAKINKVKVVKINKNNEEIGVICKKPFSVSVLGY